MPFSLTDKPGASRIRSLSKAEVFADHPGRVSAPDSERARSPWEEMPRHRPQDIEERSLVGIGWIVLCMVRKKEMGLAFWRFEVCGQVLLSQL